jgi:hypothetical protein
MARSLSSTGGAEQPFSVRVVGRRVHGVGRAGLDDAACVHDRVLLAPRQLVRKRRTMDAVGGGVDDPGDLGARRASAGTTSVSDSTVTMTTCRPCSIAAIECSAAAAGDPVGSTTASASRSAISAARSRSRSATQASSSPATRRVRVNIDANFPARSHPPEPATHGHGAT